MTFDYERETRTKYQSEDIASRYHRNPNPAIGVKQASNLALIGPAAMQQNGVKAYLVRDRPGKPS